MTSTARRSTTLVTVALALSLLGAGCGDDDDSAATTTTSEETTTTQEEATTSTETVDTTTTAPATTDGSDAAVPGGSGCNPGPGPLPDGRWYGTVESTSDDAITFDLACWFVGEDAVRAAAEDGEESPPPNDYYVRNDSPTTRDVPVAAPATVEWYPVGNPNDPHTVSYAEWSTARTTRLGDFGVWLVVEGGTVRAVEEQWVP